MGRPRGGAADGAELLLELGGGGALYRPVARVVGPWRHLVDEQISPARQKELHAGRPDDPQLLEDACGYLDGLPFHLGWDPGRRDGQVEYVLIVGVAYRPVVLEGTVRAAGGDDGELHLEVHPRLEHGLDRKSV